MRLSTHNVLFRHDQEAPVLARPLGAGKITGAAACAQLPCSLKVHFLADDFWTFIIKHGAIVPYLPESHAQNSVVMDALSRTVSPFAEDGYFLILDGIIGPLFLPTFLGLEGTRPLRSPATAFRCDDFEM
ncbi:hypothetical protein [Achromobacter insolitus]|uniref:hypothetical protein n=1 Tax=Achromobacter insolitus TaxID=217204 RepID=UPI0015838402|nr:hypothetical protein [Achromobacter insolitus]